MLTTSATYLVPLRLCVILNEYLTLYNQITDLLNVLATAPLLYVFMQQSMRYGISDIYLIKKAIKLNVQAHREIVRCAS